MSGGERQVILSVMASGAMNVPAIWGVAAFAFGIVAFLAIFLYFSKRF